MAETALAARRTLTFSPGMKQILLSVALGLYASTALAKQIPDFAAANLVLGQTNFTTGTAPGAVNASSLDSPSAVVVDPRTGKVFVSDTGNNRVLRFASASALQNGAEAEAVFGQATGTTNTAPPAAADSLDSPTGIWLDSGNRLWVADTDNNRVVMYQNATTSGNGPSATLILGQPDTTTEAAPNPPSAATLNGPEGLWMDGSGRLWVADKGNNRVLRYENAANSQTGMQSAEADAVLGQTGPNAFTTSTGGSDNQHFQEPTAVTVDPSGTLWVADKANNRVVGFPGAGTISSGTNAARILGQNDFNGGSTNPGLSASAINGPAGVYADAADNLWVVDQGNNRVLRFAGLKSIENGKRASGVVGQANFTTNTPGLSNRRIDIQGGSSVAGVFVQGDGSLWVSDANQHRVLRFATVDSEAPVVRISGKSKITTTKKRLVVKGTASDDSGIASVTLKVGRKTIPVAGTTSWKRAVKLAPGRTVVKAMAVDTVGKTSNVAKLVIIRKTPL